jgi:peroxiredoxin
VLPSLKEWDETYRSQGLVVIGNHYPEFSFEEDFANLERAVESYGIKYAVAQDNNGATWRAYKNRYWPTLYLIDKQGRIRYVHIGEGRYEETEAAIQALLTEEYP